MADSRPSAGFYCTHDNAKGGILMANKLDSDAVSAAIAGFLACHVLTCRFLADEGVIDKERFVAYLETAMAEMSPGLVDQRSLFGVTQLLNALRAPAGASVMGQPN
jgi:hypothetical protein